MPEKYAATVGFFDGVHAGHRFLIRELKHRAAQHQLKSMVITFSIHPRKVLQTAYQPQLLTNAEEKLNLLEQTGVDEVVVLDFTPEMAKLSAQEFMQLVLIEQYNVNLLLVGHDHRFGHNRSDSFAEYEAYGRQLGMTVIRAQRYSTRDYRHISSSDIRQAIEYGQIEMANELLTYPYTFTGKVINGFKVGRKIGFPTANLSPVDHDKIIPGTGVYAVEVLWQSEHYKGMMNIGLRPTLANSKEMSMEVHIIDFNDNIYGHNIKVTVLKKIREERKFTSVDELIEQLKLDKNFVVNLT